MEKEMWYPDQIVTDGSIEAESIVIREWLEYMREDGETTKQTKESEE